MLFNSLLKHSKIPKIIEIWIFNNSGLLLLNARNSRIKKFQKIDPLLFSGMLAAMEFLSKKRLNHIAMNDLQLILLPVIKPFPLFLVASTYRYVSSRRVRNVLQEIYEEFSAEFQEILPYWSGNLSIFSYFQEKIINKYF